jgi:protein-tyrosine phosphatase
VLAHPERNLAIIESPRKLYDWVAMGILTQITAASLLGQFGTAVRKFTVFLLEHRMAHILATDTHGSRVRTPKLSEALRVAEQISGAEAARRMVCDRPLSIIRGEAVVCPEPVPVINPNRGNIFRRLSSYLNGQRG